MKVHALDDLHPLPFERAECSTPAPHPFVQVMGMPGMVLTVAESLRLSTPMTFDALTFVILRKLSAAKRKLKVWQGEWGVGCPSPGKVLLCIHWVGVGVPLNWHHTP